MTTTRKRKPPQSLYVVVDDIRPSQWSFMAYESKRQAERVALDCNHDSIFASATNYVVVRYVKQRKPK